MELSAMLNYQKLDMQLMKLENELMQSDIAREYASNKKALAVAQEQVVKQNRDAGEMIKQMEGLLAEYDALEKELKEAEEAVPDVRDVNGADFFLRNVQKLIAQLKNLSAEISKMSSKIVELNQAHATTMATGKEVSRKWSACKAAYEAEKAKFRPAAMELQEKIAAAEKDCSEQFLEVYKRLRKQKKIPVVVPLEGRSCGGCFMELAGDTVVKLDNQPFVECPDCGRILYRVK